MAVRRAYPRGAGFATAAVLKLFPRPKGREVAWAAVPSPAAALALFFVAYIWLTTRRILKAPPRA